MRRSSLLAVIAVPLLAVPLAIGCSSGDDEPVVGDGPATTLDDGGVTVDDDASVPVDAATVDDAGVGIPDAKADTLAPVDTGTTPPADTGAAGVDSGAAGDWPAAYAALEEQVLVETNKRRALGADCRTGGKFPPAKPLVMHPLLQAAARKHSKDMALNNFFAHTNLAGLSPFDRMKAEGYKGTTMGENIAAGNATAAQTVTQWMNSDGHCANIMSAKYTQLGVGYFYSATSKYKHYWTQNFGAGG